VGLTINEMNFTPYPQSSYFSGNFYFAIATALNAKKPYLVRCMSNNLAAYSPGNVRATVTDRKIASFEDPGTDWTITGFTADITSAQDYYPFGWTMPGRQYNSDSYRYGYNTQEKVDEIKGSGNHLTAKYWEYDPRIGRRWNMDPVVLSYESGYVTNGNNPIWYLDPLGDFKTKFGAWMYSLIHGGKVEGEKGNYYVNRSSVGADGKMVIRPWVYEWNSSKSKFGSSRKGHRDGHTSRSPVKTDHYGVEPQSDDPTINRSMTSPHAIPDPTSGYQPGATAGGSSPSGSKSETAKKMADLLDSFTDQIREAKEWVQEKFSSNEKTNADDVKEQVKQSSSENMNLKKRRTYEVTDGDSTDVYDVVGPDTLDYYRFPNSNSDPHEYHGPGRKVK